MTGLNLTNVVRFFLALPFLCRAIGPNQVDRSVLEEFIPYALMHAGYLDMSRSALI